MAMTTLTDWLGRCPLIAILRGVRPEEVVDIGAALYRAGLRIVEIPLSSPDPLASVALLSGRFGDRMLVGAGGIMEPAQVEQVADAGGRLAILPHADIQIVVTARRLGLVVIPGFCTPTEAFTMISAGASGLKLFPAEGNPPAVLEAMRGVLPAEMPIIPVGSISPANMGEYWHAGAAGFGLGPALYRPGMNADAVAAAGSTFISTLGLLAPGRG
jgi:2-dehydro-3-deoxyphosphogalactonate aldolase